MRRLLLAVAALAALAIPAYAGYWLYVASELSRGLAPWAAVSRAQGVALDWQSVAVGGFPFSFRVHLTATRLSAAGPIPYTATSGDVVLTARPFDLTDWRFSAPSGARLRAPTLAAGIDADALSGSVALARDGTVVVLSAHALAGRDAAEGFAADALDTTVTLPAHAPLDHRDEALAVTMSVRHLSLPEEAKPLPPLFDAISVAAVLKGRLPPGALASALASWRDDGGTLEIEQAHLAWNGATLDLAGTLALDEAMQPTGAFTATIVGADRMVDDVVAAGALQKRYASLAKSVLRAISAPGGGGTGALHVPLTVQDQRLFVGPAAIAALPRIDWK